MKKKIFFTIIWLIILPQLKMFPQKSNLLTRDNFPIREAIVLRNSVHKQSHFGDPGSYRNRETLGEEWDGAAWIPDKNFLYTYEAGGHLIEYKTQHRTGSEWTDTLLTAYNFDNNMDTAISYHYWNGWQWLNDSRHLYTYDIYGYTRISVYQNGDSLNWINNSRTLNYRDNITHHIDSLSYQVWNASAWEDYIKEFHYYDSQLKDSVVIDYIWTGMDWTNFSKYLYIQDKYTSSDTVTYLRWTGTEWTIKHRNLHFFDKNDNFLGYTYQIWENDEWKNKYRYLYEYDQDNNNTIIWYQVYSSGYGWEIVTESDMEYNTDNLKILKTDKSWEGAVSTNSYRWTYSYDEIPVSAIPEVTDDFLSLDNYPNPFSSSTKIIFSIPVSTRISLKIYDIQGREIITLLEEERPAGNYVTEFTSENMSPGIYFCKLVSGPYTMTKKIILRR